MVAQWWSGDSQAYARGFSSSQARSRCLEGLATPMIEKKGAIHRGRYDRWRGSEAVLALV